MWSTFRLINKSFWWGFIGPIFAYLISLALLLFVGRIIGPIYIVPSVFLIPSLCILLIFMPQSIFEFKNSSILKRIWATPINPLTLLLTIGLFNCFLILSSMLLMIGLSFAIFYDSLQNVNVPIAAGSLYYKPDYLYMFMHANWLDFIYALLVMIIMGIFFGMFITSVSQSTIFIQAGGIAMLLIVFFIGPVAFPVSRVAQIDLIKYIGYIIPFRYPIALSVEAFTSTISPTIINAYAMFVNTTNMHNINFVVHNQTDKLLNLIMPWVFILIFGYLTSVTFNWSNRTNKLFRWNVTFVAMQQLFKHNQSAFQTLPQTCDNQANNFRS